jgi:hypothetical protein
MKNLLRFLTFALFIGCVFAQSNLPVCRAGTHFNNCFGTETYGSGNKYVGEFKDGNYNGNGTLYAADGSVIKSGIWVDGELKSSQSRLVTTQKNPNSTLEKFTDNTDLPICRPGTHFNNCFGTEVYASGNKYVGGFKDAKYHGGGTLYSPNGGVIKSGIWKEGELKSSLQSPQVHTNKQSLQVDSYKQELEKLKVDAEEAKRKQLELDSQLKNTLEKLRIESEDAKKKQADLERQLRLAQQQAQTPIQQPAMPSVSERISSGGGVILESRCRVWGHQPGSLRMAQCITELDDANKKAQEEQKQIQAEASEKRLKDCKFKMFVEWGMSNGRSTTVQENLDRCMNGMPPVSKREIVCQTYGPYDSRETRCSSQ